MDERAACQLLKKKFEDAGYHIEENRAFDEAGVRFEIDGFDPDARVGYEYKTRESGDDWDVDDAVVATLEARRKSGELFVLVVAEDDAPDAAALDARATAFLRELPARDDKKPKKPAAATKKDKPKPPAKKPRAKK
jgi:hypothetical protein